MNFLRRNLHTLCANTAWTKFFGTDYPLSDYELEHKRFGQLDLTDEEKEKIFYKNAYKLLGL